MKLPDSLAGWLAFAEHQHHQTIALGLERVQTVRLRLAAHIACPVITVGGTNGKGSTCALLESILRSAGYRTGLYSSPHLLRYNERVRVAGSEATDAELCRAFAAVEQARAGVPLTYFEFGTLAALWHFARVGLDAVILEVGLGGRLDAVNTVDPDCAVITSVDLDHMELLGDTRESVGSEKAGIFRSGRPAVVALADPPQSVCDAAASTGARLLLLGRDFGFAGDAAQWSYWGPFGKRHGLAFPALRGAIQLRNAAAAMCALDTLRERLPVAMQEIREGLAMAALPGRFQVVPGRPQIILDVGHNPEAARVLRDNLRSSGFAPNTIAVVGMLRDKDISGVAAALSPVIDAWHLASLQGPRGATSDLLASVLARVAPSTPHTCHAGPVEAFRAARSAATPDDKIVVFGSFLTVGAVLALLSAEKGASHG